MAKKSQVRFNLSGLQVLQTSLRKLTDSGDHVQVGIFGDKTTRKKGGITNAEVGFIHEMGSVTRNIPRRSFLWDTLNEHGNELMTALKADALTLFKSGKTPQFLHRVGGEAENLVQMAFDTGGFGKWALLSYKTLMRKAKGGFLRRAQQAAEDIYEGGHNVAMLVKTGQLRRAVASRVVKGT